MNEVRVFDETRCSLGEGPLWHPERQELLWFDINGHRLYARSGNARNTWQFGEYVSAAGWVSREKLLVASETALSLFDLETGASEPVCALEADNPLTRSNDGRADPYGGFWIGTMGKRAETGAGAIYRYYRGEVRRLFAPWTIPNAICFAPDGGHAYLADTATNRIWRQALDAKGWPKGEPEIFLDLPASTHCPDGAVVDARGRMWCAHYGYGKVTVFRPDGGEEASYAVPGRHSTCPAFGGEGLHTLFVTTATQELKDATDDDGRTYCLDVDATGQQEHRVVL